MCQTKGPKRNNKYYAKCGESNHGKFLVKLYLGFIAFDSCIILPQGFFLDLFIYGPYQRIIGKVFCNMSLP